MRDRHSRESQKKTSITSNQIKNMTENTTPFPDGWTYGHGICFVYFTFAELADGDFSSDEASVIKTKCAEWNMADDTLVEAYKFFAGKSYGEILALANQCWGWILASDDLTIENKKAMIADLKSIANADGKVTADETDMLGQFEESVMALSN